MIDLTTDGWAWRRPTESEKGLPFVYGECPFCFAPNRDHERRKGLGEANEMARSLELKEQLHQTGLAVELEAQRSAKAIAGQRGEQIHVIDKRFEKRLLGTSLFALNSLSLSPSLLCSALNQHCSLSLDLHQVA